MNLVIVNLLIAVAFLQGITGTVGQLSKQLRLANPMQLYAGATDSANCTGVSGNICGVKATDCDSIFLCIPSMPDPIKATCETGLTCNAGKCSAVKSPLCEYGEKQFKCNNEGMYPEPSSCKKFNYCVPTAIVLPTPGTTLTLTGSECAEGWGYNPVTASCDKKLINNNCPAMNRIVPPCLTVGQNGALMSNPRLYYICLPYSDTDQGLYPSIYKCPGNTRYSGNYRCL